MGNNRELITYGRQLPQRVGTGRGAVQPVRAEAAAGLEIIRRPQAGWVQRSPSLAENGLAAAIRRYAEENGQVINLNDALRTASDLIARRNIPPEYLKKIEGLAPQQSAMFDFMFGNTYDQFACFFGGSSAAPVQEVQEFPGSEQDLWDFVDETLGGRSSLLNEDVEFNWGHDKASSGGWHEVHEVLEEGKRHSLPDGSNITKQELVACGRLDLDVLMEQGEVVPRGGRLAEIKDAISKKVEVTPRLGAPKIVVDKELLKPLYSAPALPELTEIIL